MRVLLACREHNVEVVAELLLRKHSRIARIKYRLAYAGLRCGVVARRLAKSGLQSFGKVLDERTILVTAGPWKMIQHRKSEE